MSYYNIGAKNRLKILIIDLERIGFKSEYALKIAFRGLKELFGQDEFGYQKNAGLIPDFDKFFTKEIINNISLKNKFDEDYLKKFLIKKFKLKIKTILNNIYFENKIKKNYYRDYLEEIISILVDTEITEDDIEIIIVNLIGYYTYIIEEVFEKAEIG